MTNPNLTHLYFLLDRSGSMDSIKSDTEGGFNAFMTEQRRLPGECRVTLAQFDNAYEEVYRDLPVGVVPPCCWRRAAPPPCSTRSAASSARPACVWLRYRRSSDPGS